MEEDEDLTQEEKFELLEQIYRQEIDAEEVDNFNYYNQDNE